MPFKTGYHYVWDCRDMLPARTVNFAHQSLAQAQSDVAGRVYYDQAAGQSYHYEIFERMSNGDLIRRQIDQQS
jgi:hypothetical protein